ncbi:hypothetical protein D5086_014128 [Populus alba]|uniref:Uncharacterized protein n=1 Tax=Populus alba TaxID=43335 RepID=A0ACC4C837_POPAL
MFKLQSGDNCLAAAAMTGSYLPATTDSITLASKAEDPFEAISILHKILENPSSSPDAIRIKEQAITILSDLFTQHNMAEDLHALLSQLRPFFAVIPKAKTAKIVRGIIDSVSKIPGTSDVQIALCKELVLWARVEKRALLRQRVETRLAALLVETKEYSEALALLTNLIKEVKGVDDKRLLVEILLLESKLHYLLKDRHRARTALTAAKKAANAVYMQPTQQGTIDLHSGILFAEDKEYTTAYSYFFEAFEVLRDYKYQLETDPTIYNHLSSRYEALVELNLCRDIEPFSRVEISHIAGLIDLPVDFVEKKLAQMILDRKFAGILDQGAGHIIIFDEPKEDALLPAALKTISSIGKVVDSLFVKSSKIVH